MRYTITDEGLVFQFEGTDSAIAEDRQDLAEQAADIGDEAAFLEVIEYSLCNGLSLVAPETVGALTDSLILSEGALDDNGDWSSDAPVFWFPDYQVKGYAATLLHDGKIVFQRA